MKPGMKATITSLKRQQLQNKYLQSYIDMHITALAKTTSESERIDNAFEFLAKLVATYQDARTYNINQSLLFIDTADQLWRRYAQAHEVLAQAEGDTAWPSVLWWRQWFAQNVDHKEITNPKTAKDAIIAWRRKGWGDPRDYLAPSGDVLELEHDIIPELIKDETEYNKRVAEVMGTQNEEETTETEASTAQDEQGTESESGT